MTLLPTTTTAATTTQESCSNFFLSTLVDDTFSSPPGNRIGEHTSNSKKTTKTKTHSNMRPCRFALMLALAAPLSTTMAWTPSATSSWSRNSQVRQQQQQPQSSFALQATVENSTEEQTKSLQKEVTAASALKPEYDAALNMIQGQLQAKIPEKYLDNMYPLIAHFAKEYVSASQASVEAVPTEENLKFCHPNAVVQRFLGGIQLALQWGMGPNKYQFNPLHKACRGLDPESEFGNTMDLYKVGNDFFRACIDYDKSVIHGQDNIDKVVEQLKAGENVVMFANHQSEADPQAVSCMTEALLPNPEYAEKFFSQMIYVAGHKVTTDPLAVPFSMGRNLICIHSKKHIDADPETKASKQKQNLRSMSAMLETFKKGGTLLWVAPSGGRDRRNVESGDVPIAPFDSKTIDMFRLIGRKSKTPTHFYTMAMVTYDLCPPPDVVEAGVGEARNIRFTPCGIAVGNELDNEGGLESRHDFCDHAFEQCQNDYEGLLKVLD